MLAGPGRPDGDMCTQRCTGNQCTFVCANSKRPDNGLRFFKSQED